MVSFSGFASPTNTLIYFPDIFQQVRAASVWANKKSLRSVKFLQIILQSNIALQEKVFLREKCAFSIKKVCQPAEVID